MLKTVFKKFEVHFKFFKCCFPQILLGPFLNTLTQITEHDYFFQEKKARLLYLQNSICFRFKGNFWLFWFDTWNSIKKLSKYWNIQYWNGTSQRCKYVIRLHKKLLFIGKHWKKKLKRSYLLMADSVTLCAMVYVL